MNSWELAFGLIVVGVLVGLAGYFGWRQIAALKRLARQTDLTPEDRLYFKQQAQRRLVGCGLMLLLAALLAGSYFLEVEFAEIARQAEQKLPKTPDSEAVGKAFLRRFAAYWIGALGVLFLFGLLAILDLRATLRYGLRHHRQLRDQHRSNLEAEVRRIRKERNGHS